jgi:hypothetical protein
VGWRLGDRNRQKAPLLANDARNGAPDGEDTKPKKTTTIKETAEKYVDEQLELLKSHGTPVRISKSGYNSMVNQVARVSK